MEITSETIKNISFEQLALIRQGLPSDHPDAIVIDNEIHRHLEAESSKEANRLAREANALSREANSIALSARNEARRANRIAIIAAIIAAASMMMTIIMAVFK
jgi:hypothetical protein